MRGADVTQEGLFIVRKTSDYVPAEHPLLAIREILNTALRDMDRLFESMYEERGRYSVPPEWLLRGLVLQALYGIRSERLLCEQLGYNMLFRWFVGLGMEDTAWDHSTYTQNRDRLIDHDAIKTLFGRVMQQAEAAKLLSSEHFSVDGTLIQAWAGHKSFVRKDRDDDGDGADFRGEKRSNETHESTTDPDARLARKSGGHEAKLASGNVLIENRNGLVVDTELMQSNGTAERDAAMRMAVRIEGVERVTVAADKGYDTKEFVAEMRHMNVTPHVAQNDRRRGGSAIDSRTTRHAGYKVSQRKRKRIEEVFGWLKTVGALRKTRHRGIFKVGWVFTFAAAAYNLVRMRNLLTPAVQEA